MSGGLVIEPSTMDELDVRSRFWHRNPHADSLARERAGILCSDLWTGSQLHQHVNIDRLRLPDRDDVMATTGDDDTVEIQLPSGKRLRLCIGVNAHNRS